MAPLLLPAPLFPPCPPLEGNFALPSRSVSPNGKAGTRGPVAEKEISQGTPPWLPYFSLLALLGGLVRFGRDVRLMVIDRLRLRGTENLALWGLVRRS